MTLSWNCRGLGNLETINELLDIASNFKPNFIFLMEVKIDRERVEVVQKQLKYNGLCFYPGENNGGGVALLWRDKNTARLISIFLNFIDIEVCLVNSPRWRLMGFYRYPERSRRCESWAMLKNLLLKSSLLWCEFGDFNDLMANTEKRGKNRHPIALINGFRITVDQ